jgi:hypothetical protein
MNSPGFKRIVSTIAYSAVFFVCCGMLRMNAQKADHPIPKIVHRDGRYALFVDGAPYLMLGAQINNSSAWPAMLPKVWPAIEAMHANTTPNYETGGATDNVLPIWKATAPAIDVLAPDIYMNDREHYFKVLDLYHRPDNPLFVPETSRSAFVAPMFFEALGRQTIGFSPFGVDFTSTSQNPEWPGLTKEALVPFAMNYELIGPMDREIARRNFEGKLQAVAEEKGKPLQTLEFGPWEATVSYGLPHFGSRNSPPSGNPEPIGRALIAQLGDNKYLVAGFFCRVDFHLSDTASTKQRQFMRVEEGNFRNGVFKPIRIWNGDQTDWGLNFGSAPQALQVSLGTY